MPMTTVPDVNRVPVYKYAVSLAVHNLGHINKMAIETRLPPQRDLIMPVDGKEYILTEMYESTQVGNLMVQHWWCKPYDITQ